MWQCDRIEKKRVKGVKERRKACSVSEHCKVKMGRVREIKEKIAGVCVESVCVFTWME